MPPMASVGLLLACLSITSATNLKVGLYNSIPDLQKDGFATYQSMVENGFNTAEHTVNAVVDPKEYSPYGDLKEYLTNGGFDLIEMDTASLLSVIDEGLIVEVGAITPIPADTLPTARSSVQAYGRLFGYPTLACGNFMIGLSPSSECTCPLREFRTEFASFRASVEECKSLVQVPYLRLIGGKMNDASGWYLPFLYLDAYIDVYGPGTIDRARQELKEKHVDQTVCENLLWFIGLCTDSEGKNNCFALDGDYVESSSAVITDINDKETMHYFGFSERSALLNADRCQYSAVSWPLGPSNYMLQFTDALVVGRKAWEEANEDKKNVIREFIKYFTGNELRRKIALGEDLQPPKNRYLLQATETFYKSVSNPVYQDIYWQLQRSVAAPSPSTDEKQAMQIVLQNALDKKCVMGDKKTEL